MVKINEKDDTQQEEELTPKRTRSLEINTIKIGFLNSWRIGNKDMEELRICYQVFAEKNDRKMIRMLTFLINYLLCLYFYSSTVMVLMILAGP